ncbi:MAG: NAD(+) synthase [Acholeplasmataceae bacterium]
MMFKEGFLKVSTISPAIKVGKPILNGEIIKEEIKRNKASLLVFPELSLTGYSCGDLFYQEQLYDESLRALNSLLKEKFNKIIALGMPLIINSELYNVLVVFQKDVILGAIVKKDLVNNNFFNESRWFKSSLELASDKVTILGQEVPLNNLIFKAEDHNFSFGFEFNNNVSELTTSGEELYLNGANLIINLSTNLAYLGLDKIIETNVKAKSLLYEGAYLFLASSNDESTGDGLYSGFHYHAVFGRIENKSVYDLKNRLTSDLDLKEIEYRRRKANKKKNNLNNYKIIKVAISTDDDFTFDSKIAQIPFLVDYDFEAVRFIQTKALEKRIKHLNNPRIIIGVSGGLDSSLALLVAYDTINKMNLSKEKIMAVVMPSVHTSEKTYQNALTLIKALAVPFQEINIDVEVEEQLKMIAHDNKTDVTYENVQARIRTQTLMNLANKHHGIVLGTGNLSEIALGFMTYNADQMSMYAINAGLPKTMVQRHLKEYLSYYPHLYDVVVSILQTPISPELKDNQYSEEIVGSYLINDFLIYRHLVCGDSEKRLIFLLKEAFSYENKAAESFVKSFLKRFKTAQFKRQVIPDGPQVTELSLSARNHFKMASDSE